MGPWDALALVGGAFAVALFFGFLAGAIHIEIVVVSHDTDAATRRPGTRDE